MKQSINEYDFRNAFMAVRPNNFSYEGLTVLFDALEEYEESTGEEMEMDVIAICCDFSEYTLKDIKGDYDMLNDCETIKDCVETLADYTWVIPVNDDTVIIQNF